MRNAAQWSKLVAANPFPREAREDPSHLLVFVAKRAMSVARVKALQAAIRGPERAEGAAGAVYVHYPAGVGGSKLTQSLIDRALESRATARNWNTTVKLDALLRA